MGFFKGCHSQSFQKQLAVLNMDMLGGASSSQNVLERVPRLEIWLCYFLISPEGGESLEKKSLKAF